RPLASHSLGDCIREPLETRRRTSNIEGRIDGRHVVPGAGPDHPVIQAKRCRPFLQVPRQFYRTVPNASKTEYRWRFCQDGCGFEMSVLLLHRVETGRHTNQNVLVAEAPFPTHALSPRGIDANPVRIDAVLDNVHSLGRKAELDVMFP